MHANEIMNELLSLMGLRLEEEERPSVKINSESAPRRFIGQLVRQNFIPSYQSAPDDLRWLVKGEGDVETDTSIHIIDLLGVYNSGKNEVVLYDLLIKLCAFQLEIDYERLKAIVMMHELSHAITHRGIDSDNSIWVYFDQTTPDITEYFAQIYTYKKLCQDNNELCLKDMAKLSEIQSDVYQKYKNSIAKPIEELNKELFNARRIIPAFLQKSWQVQFDNLIKYERCVGHSSFHCDPNHPGPKSIFETETKGTMFTITANTIRIESYDYRTSSSEFSPKSTMDVYKLISNKEDQFKKQSTRNNHEKPIFCITFENDEYYLNLSDPVVRDLWGEIVTIISNDYPTLGEVLRGYEEEFA